MKNVFKCKKGRAVCLWLTAAVLGCSLTACGGSVKIQDATVELGTRILRLEHFLPEGAKPEKAIFVTDMSTIDLTKPGNHQVTLAYEGKEQTVNLTIVDSTAPQAQILPERVVQAGESLDVMDFVQNVSDVSQISVAFVQEPQIPVDYSDITVEVVITDASGNETRGTSQVRFHWMHQELNWELGKPITKQDILVNAEKDAALVDQARLDAINAAGVGSYTLDVNGKTCAITVADTKGPDLKVQMVHIWPQEYITVNNFVSSCDDPSGVASVELLSELDTLNKGERPVKIKAVDNLGNETVAEAVLKVNLDHSAPVIQGVEDLQVERGVAPDYTTGITAADNIDGPVPVSYDDSEVDLETAGIYFATYTAQDEAGNITTVRRKVMVPPLDEEIQAMIEEVAAGLSDDPKEIRDFVWKNIRYSANWGEPQPTWHGFTNWSGNCMVHATCLQDLLEAKGYETMLIWTRDKSHYWVLVNLEKLGMGWRHMDATPSEQHIRILYMNDWERYENLDGRNWDRTLWPEAK